MKLLITGAAGFLGSRIALYLKDRDTILAPSHSEFDLTRPEEMEQFFRLNRPDAVIHCAAISDTGYCETHPEESLAINAKGPASLAAVCRRYGAKLLFMSSDQVYNGVTHLIPNTEDQSLTPRSVYAGHKLAAEQKIAELCPDAVVLRLTWLFDLPIRGLKTNRNLLTALFGAVYRGEPAVFSSNDYRAMTYAWDLVREMPALLTLPGGVYNAGSENFFSAYETARRAAELSGACDLSRIQKRKEAPGSSPRNLMISTEKLKSQGIFFPDTLQAAARCLMDFGLLPRQRESSR